MAILNPFNLKKWVDENRRLLKPPVGNKVVYKGNDDFMVMVVGGPNSRKDYHYNEGEELFFQLEGDIVLKIIEDGVFKDINICEGDMFLLPPKIPHLPKRGANTIGLVIERYRKENELDGFLWFCEKCQEPLHQTFIPVSDIVTQLPIAMNEFYDSDQICCKKCGYKMDKPK